MTTLSLDGRFILGGAFLAAFLSASAYAEKDPLHPSAMQDEITGTNKGQRSDKAADNTARNRDDSITAQEQGHSKSDIELTAQVRRAIVADKQLSTAAHNVKIITQSGVVTLKGPVKSVGERRSIDLKAKELAGDTNVKNELDVAP
jgi:osmotically-inducible protein OsmY